MVSKSTRRFLAPWVIGAVVFAQLVLTAHACGVHGSAAPLVMMHAASPGEAGHHPCADMAAAPEMPQANACEVHCTDGAAFTVSPDLPTVTLAALPAPAVLLTALAATDGAAKAPSTAQPGAPPATLAFCRLLI